MTFPTSVRCNFFMSERENDKIVMQISTGVFAGANVHAYAKAKTNKIDLEIAGLTPGRFKVDDNRVIAAHRRFESSGSFLAQSGNVGISPFATIQYKGWGVNAVSIPVSGIKTLSRCPFSGGKGVFPPESIPVIDMKSDRHKLVPKPRVAYQPAQRSLGRWTTAAAL